MFKFLSRKPALEEASQGPLYAAVRAAMTDVQAYARSHGGEIQLVGVDEDGTVRIRFGGLCKSCPLSGITLKHGVEEQLKQLVPGVKKVLQEK